MINLQNNQKLKVVWINVNTKLFKQFNLRKHKLIVERKKY